MFNFIVMKLIVKMPNLLNLSTVGDTYCTKELSTYLPSKEALKRNGANPIFFCGQG